MEEVLSTLNESNPNVRLSVLLPVHRINKYVFQAIDSVLQQSFSDFELLVIFNGPEAGKTKELKDYYQDSRIVYLQTEIPSLANALNLGLQNAKAEIIVRMDSDDVCEYFRLKEINDVFTNFPGVAVFASNYSLINEKSEVLPKKRKMNFSSSAIRRILPYRCIIAHPTVAFKKKVIIDAGGYSFGSCSEDYDLWLRLRRNKKVIFMVTDKKLLRYRVHDEQITGLKNNNYLFGHDLSLKIRELIITKDLAYFLGIFSTVIDYFYRIMKNFWLSLKIE